MFIWTIRLVINENWNKENQQKIQLKISLLLLLACLEAVFHSQYKPQYKIKHFYNASLYNLNINISSIIFLFYFFIWFLSSPRQYLYHVRINSLIIGMIMICDLIETYNQFVFKCFDFSPFKVSCLKTYIAAMCFSTVYIRPVLVVKSPFLGIFVFHEARFKNQIF